MNIKNHESSRIRRRSKELIAYSWPQKAFPQATVKNGCQDNDDQGNDDQGPALKNKRYMNSLPCATIYI
jgi:hypothetical protein